MDRSSSCDEAGETVGEKNGNKRATSVDKTIRSHTGCSTTVCINNNDMINVRLTASVSVKTAEYIC